jgi:hypothetical protein
MRAGLQFPYQIKYLRVLHVRGAKVGAVGIFGLRDF